MPAPTRAADGDIWFHHIIAGGKYSRDPLRVRDTYIAREFDPTSPTAERPWEAELSGRLLSKSANIREFAEEVAARFNNPGIKFRAVLHAKVADLRANGWDVWDDPTDDDPAHAVLTVPQLNPVPVLPSAPPMPAGAMRIDQKLVHAIAERLSLTEAQDIHALEAGCLRLS